MSLAWASATAWILAVSLAAQNPPPVTPSFDVASVKPNTSGSGSSNSRLLPGGGVSAINVRLRQLVVWAYEMRDFQVVGGPGWIDGERFDISARAPEVTSSGNTDTMPMLRALLADRFKLVVHREKREQPVYELLSSRSDGRLGPQIRRSRIDCGSPTPPPEAAAAFTEPPLGLPSCGTNTSTTSTQATMRAGGRSMADLAMVLSTIVTNRMVVDRTGLAGTFDYELRWTPESALGTVTSAGGDHPSVFTALQEQLGLKLEAGRGPVEFLVIESVERPTPD